jgi:hypothetical protein
MSVIDSSQNPPASGIITGTFVDLWDNGDDFILDANGTQYIVDPQSTDARNFNFSPGETLEVRVDEFDGREIDSSSITRVAPGAPTTTPGSALNGFDGDRYLRENPDVAAAGVDPVQHFWNHGALEGRLPDLFDENFYLQANPDVAAAVAANSVSSGWEHFRYHGAREGRQGSATGSLEFNQAIAVGFGNPAPTPPSNDPLTGSPMVDSDPTPDSTDSTPDPLTNFSGQTLAGTVVRLTDEDDFLIDTPNGRFEVETLWDERRGVLPVQPGQSLTVIGRFDDELSSLGVPEFEATQVIQADGSRLI